MRPLHGENMKEQIERICANCNNFCPDSLEWTEFGICLADPAFEPYLDELLDHSNFEGCRELVEEKRLSGNQDACPEYDEADFPVEEEDMLAKLIGLRVPDSGEALPPSPKYSFRDHSFAWLLKYDVRLREFREIFQRYTAKDRRLVADYEYHAGPARKVFAQLTEEPEDPTDLPSEVVALAIDPEFAPAILTVGTHEYLLGRIEEAMELLLSLVRLPPDTEDLVIIIDKAGGFLAGRQDYANAVNLYEAAAAKFPDEPVFQKALAYCQGKQGQ